MNYELRTKNCHIIEKQIKNLLKKIGLDEMETACYLELLKKSPQKASQIARKIDAPKSTVHLNLGQLVDIYGLVKREKHKNYYLFRVEDACDLTKMLELRAEKAQQTYEKVKNLLPELRALQEYEFEKPKILYFEGREGLKRAFEMMLDEADEIVGYGNHEDEVRGMTDIFPDYYERRVKKKILVSQAIAPATDFNLKESLKNEDKHLRQTRFVDKENLPRIHFNIYKDTLVFYSFAELFALVIRSKPIAGCFKFIFGLAFEASAKTDENIRKELIGKARNL